ncbi:SLBB domain-containing protein [Piscinibacter sakaiensis]|uniref:polysaccharide biosynthesis/export family protein n=1 Tax=Piscinibacter sakaiensis TaxID=1547922 RepID=UPI003AAC727F
MSAVRRVLACLLLLGSAAMHGGVSAQTNPGFFNAPGYVPSQPSRAQTPRTAPNAEQSRERAGDAERGRRPVDERGARDADGRPFDDRLEPDRSRALPPPPPRPSEFQKFVELATGRLLQPFGHRFFADSAEAEIPADNVPVSADYIVSPGDEIVLRAWGSLDVDYRSKVDRNGQLNLPRVGSFNVAGVKASDLEAHLRAQLSRLYTNFSLSVSLGQLRAVKVFVVGPATRPGVYTLPSQATLLSAAVAAGGPAPNGSMRRLSLRRDGKIVSELDIYDFLVTGNKTRDLQLAAGDVIVFHNAGPQVALAGATDSPAIYELRDQTEPVANVLRYAGGASVLANPNRAQLERIDPSSGKAARFVEAFQLDVAGMRKQLRDGDILTLLAISPQFANAVTLQGHVAQPLRYPHTPGMRIRDLIPDRDALITPDFYRRKNMLVQVLEDPYPEADFRDERGRGRDRERSNERRGDRAVGADRNRSDTSAGGRDLPRARNTERETDLEITERARKSPAALFEELNWDYAVVERLDKSDLTTKVISFNLGKAVLQGDPENNIELLPGDVVTIYSQKDIRVPVGRQTRLVSVEGEVGAPGVYQLNPGETLKQLLRRAGGLTPQSYLYGLEFSREETRLRQNENLKQAMARLQALTATQAARDTANRRDDPTIGNVSAAATQAQLARLAQVQPNGRIALELTAEAKTIDALPDLPLEHADRIVVPARPGFVTVAGAVVNNNAFLWKPGRTAGDYVKLAGLDEAAEPSAMFILRADGTVSHANDSRGLFGYGGLKTQPLYPGDAVFVPNQLDFETWGRAFVRNLKDFSQIFAQFGLGAAAIQTLK